MAAVRASSSRCDFPAALSLWVWLRENETSACVAVVNGSERLRVHWLLSSCTSLSLSQEMLQGHVEGRRDVGILGEALPTSAPKGHVGKARKDGAVRVGLPVPCTRAAGPPSVSPLLLEGLRLTGVAGTSRPAALGFVHSCATFARQIPSHEARFFYVKRKHVAHASQFSCFEISY